MLSNLFSSDSRTPRQSLQEYGRGLAGGLIFSLPLLFTMEVWWAGFSISPGRLLAYVVTIFGLLLLYNRFAGLRRDASFWEVAIDSVEELGLGLVTAALVLWLLGEVSLEQRWGENLGKIVMEGMTVAIGFSVGTAQLGDEGDDDEGESDTDARAGMMNDGQNSFLSQMAIAACGAVLFISNVAPTEEILVLAIQASSERLLGVALFSLLICGLVLYFSEFRGSDRSHQQPLTNFLILRGVVATYAVALLCGAGALYFFGRFDGESPSVILSQIVIAGLPATLGASAGRLLMQSGSSEGEEGEANG